jgi:DNA-binding transcriptional LysR family regulator
LRISAAPGGRHVAARLLAAFCVRHPGVQASLHIGGVEEILARLANGEDEFSVVLSSRKPDGLETTPVGTEQLCVYARAGHPLAGQPRIDPRLLAREPVVLREPGSAMRDAFLDACGLNIGELVVRAELGSNEAIAEAIARGVGVGLLPEMEAEALIQAGALAALGAGARPRQAGLAGGRAVRARMRGGPDRLAGAASQRDTLKPPPPIWHSRKAIARRRVC